MDKLTNYDKFAIKILSLWIAFTPVILVFAMAVIAYAVFQRRKK